MKDTRAHAFIGNRDAAQYCDECQNELVGYERFVCNLCDPDGHEWEWVDRDGEVWEDLEHGIMLVLGTHERDARCFDCLVLTATPCKPLPSWASGPSNLQWSDGEVVQYARSMFVLGRVDGTTLIRIL